jgi:hypothetical protein
MLDHVTDPRRANQRVPGKLPVKLGPPLFESRAHTDFQQFADGGLDLASGIRAFAGR